MGFRLLPPRFGSQDLVQRLLYEDQGKWCRDSDLDVLVEFAHPTFRNYMGLKRFLERLVGVLADLVSVAALNRLLKKFPSAAL